MKVAASLSVFSLDSVAHIFGGKPWIAKYFAVGLRRTCRHLCWLLSCNPHPTGLTCIILNITRDFTSLKFWLSLKCCRFQTWQFEAQKGSIIPSDPPPQLQIPIDLKKEKKKKMKPTVPAGNGKENNLAFENVRLSFPILPLLCPSSKQS